MLYPPIFSVHFLSLRFHFATILTCRIGRLVLIGKIKEKIVLFFAGWGLILGLFLPCLVEG